MAPTYLGLTQAAYDFTVDYLSGRIAGGTALGERIAPVKQDAVAELLTNLEAARALFYRAVSEAHVDLAPDEWRRVFVANRMVMEIVVDVFPLEKW